jgi:O-acetyl-ADP-ribose deacetylase (regulator of RNase III)
MDGGDPRARLELVTGDLTQLRVTAIVNAANGSLLGGGGVDGAIHRAAGPGLLEACRTLGGCPTGEVRLTAGFELPAAWVIHAVGPVRRGGAESEDELLAGCYRGALEVAAERRFESVAFPAISTGVYGFPKERAARIAVRACKQHLTSSAWPRRVVLCSFSAEDAAILRAAQAEA